MRKTGRLNSRGWECLLVLGVLLTVGLSLSGIVRQKTDRALEDVRELSAGWYRLEDGQRFAVQVPGTVVLEGGGDLVLYNDSLTDADQRDLQPVDRPPGGLPAADRAGGRGALRL